MRAKNKTKNNIAKIVLIITLIILIMLVILVGIAYKFIDDKFNKINIEELNATKEELGISENNEQDPINKYRNIAILGVDSRYNDYESLVRTDCIMIASINKETNNINLVSIYRDTLVQMDLYNKTRVDKINHSYYGGVETTLKTLNTNFDLNIEEYILIDFEVVAEMVNQVNGVEINITSDELKYINSYIKENNQVNHTHDKNITKTGNQNLNGTQALAYARIRYTEGSDYKRAERMRTVLTKVFAKLKNKNVLELNQIMEIMLPKVKTNIQKNEIMTLISKGMDYNFNNTFGFPYETEDKLLDLKDYYEGTKKGKDSYTVPTDLLEDVKKLHEELFNDSDYEVSENLKQIWENIKEKGKVKN